MESSRPRVRFATVGSILACSALLLAAPATAGEGSPDGGRLLFWLLGVHMAREEGSLTKIDVNSAPVEKLETVPGISRRRAVQIAARRPYAKLPDLERAGLTPRVIDRLAAFLTVDPR
jgi:DNA uptake protein ComE-like DNA-binding protein